MSNIFNLDATAITGGVLDVAGIGDIRVVGPNGFSTIGDAVADLPATGGKILVTTGTTETDVILDKPVTIEGINGYEREASAGPHVDTSGENGFLVTSQSVTIRDLSIRGDGTGGYGVRCEVPGMTLQNVNVRKKGSHGIVIDGNNQGHQIKATVSGCEHGLYATVDSSQDGDGTYTSDCEVNISCFDNRQDGIHVANTSTDGNTNIFAGVNFTRCHAAGNTGWGFYVEDNVGMKGVTLSGYGFERNGAGSLRVRNVSNYGGGNILNISTASGKIDTLGTAWSQVAQIDHFDGQLVGHGQGELDYHLLDDFGDDTLGATAEDDLARRIGRFTGNYRTSNGDVIPGNYRPAWRSLAGTPERSSTGLKFTDGTATQQKVERPSKMQYGSWSWSFNFETAPSTGKFTFVLWRTDAGEFAFVEVKADGTLGFYYFDGVNYLTLVSSTWPVDTASHTLEVTRDAGDNWSMSLDGTQKGTATQAAVDGGGTTELYNLSDGTMTVTGVDYR